MSDCNLFMFFGLKFHQYILEILRCDVQEEGGNK